MTDAAPAISPYHTPALSVVEFNPTEDTPLAPFERTQARNLLQQVNAASPRVRAAFMEMLANVS